MSKRNKILLIVIVAILVIGLIIALILSSNRPVAPSIELPANQPLDNQATDQGLPQLPQVIQNPNPVVSDNPEADQVLAVARIFIERYGSYSSDNNFENLKEAKVFASARMSAEIDQLIAQGWADELFYGVTTKVIQSTIVSLNETLGDARVSMTMQKSETRQNQEPEVTYQDLKLDLIKSGNNWLVDSLNWQ